MTALPDLLAKRTELSPGKLALEQVATGETRTYAELDERAGRAAAALAAQGVGDGDRVAILCRNRIAFFEILFACARLGAILVPLNWRMPPAELDSLIADAEPALLLHDAADAETVRRLAAAPPSSGLDEEWETLVAGSPPVAGRSSWPEDGIWYLIYTSGTTGRPKGVIYTFGMALANHVNIGSAIGLRSTDMTACFLPLFHTAGINLHALPTLFAGGTVLLLEQFDADALVRLIEARRLDAVFAVPAVYQALLDHPRFAAAPLAHVRHWGCGGAPLPERVARQCRDLGIRLCNGMGMTETGPTAFLQSPAEAWDKIGAIGRPQLLCRARIVDDADRDAADGEVGHLLFAGPGITSGYWRNAEATAAAFTADGWLRSGDLARRDPDGCYWVAGRAKDMFVTGGENVYPVEIENVLCAHPAVADAAVVAAPDDRWGEVGRAYVQLSPGAQLDAEALKAWCGDRLAAYKVPKSFTFVHDFPRTSAGKIMKHRLGKAAPEPARECEAASAK